MAMPTGNRENPQFYGQWMVEDSGKMDGVLKVYEDKEFY